MKKIKNLDRIKQALLIINKPMKRFNNIEDNHFLMGHYKIHNSFYRFYF